MLVLVLAPARALNYKRYLLMNKLSAIFSLFVLTACSSVFSGGRQAITVKTPGVDGAMCSLYDSKGRVWYIEETPGTALVKKGDGPLSVICSKDGYLKGTGLVKEKLDDSNFANLALGPLAPVGYVVDGLTGSAEKYESTISIEMVKAKIDWQSRRPVDEDDAF